MREPTPDREARLRPGELIFVVFLTVVAFLLLSQIGEQTKFFKRLKLPMQPGFWPAIALGGMALCGVILSYSGWRSERRDGRTERSLGELLLVARAGEFMLWFMCYVWITPWLGYLLSTIVFMMCLAWRAGYRSARVQATTAVIGFGIVLLFKSFLSVKIPGGAVYDLLPPALQSFMAVNF